MGRFSYQNEWNQWTTRNGSARKISGCQNGASRSQFKAPRTKIRGATPDPGSRFCRPPGASCEHWSPRATIWAASRQSLKCYAHQTSSITLQKWCLDPSQVLQLLAVPPPPQSMLESKTGKRASATGRNFSTLNGGAGGPHT